MKSITLNQIQFIDKDETTLDVYLQEGYVVLSINDNETFAVEANDFTEFLSTLKRIKDYLDTGALYVEI